MRRNPALTLLVGIAVLALGACSSANGPATPMKLSSPAFADGDAIPVEYTCAGDEMSPALSWTEPPSGTETVALIMDDPDASGGYVHWVVFNIPASARSLEEGLPTDAEFGDGSLQGLSTSRAQGYEGPCPPSGPAHHYDFTLFALDATLDLEASSNRSAVVDAMDGHVLAEATLTGTFGQ
jgi:Raf kinase inhibitor-like YbhB/YbcL family protein